VLTLLLNIMSFSQMFSMLTKGQTPVERVAVPPVASSAGRSTSGTISVKKPTVPVVCSLSEQERIEQQNRIERLKAARLESQKQASAKTKKPDKQPRAPAKKATKSSTKSPAQPSTKTRGPTSYVPPVSHTPKKKVCWTSKNVGSSLLTQLNFKDIMKQADNVNSEKLKLTVKVRKDQPPSKRTSREGTAKAITDSRSSSPVTQKPSRPEVEKKSQLPDKQAGKLKCSGPAPFSKPMPSLLEKRRKKTAQRDEESDEDIDDFIVDDEEEEEQLRSRDIGYDRDEIWGIFNRGKRRSHFEDQDDDLSDMEATGSQVLDEERRSAYHGKKEDEREEMELQRRADAKRKKLKR
jgi:protein SPT2